MNNQDKVPNSMDGIFNLIRGMSNMPNPINRTEVETFIISTVNSADMGPETAICSGKEIYPVERYDDIQSAKIGHLKWVKFLEDGNREIISIGYGSIIGPKVINL